MPFKSEAQRRYLWANEPEIARDWTNTYGSRVYKNTGGISQLVKSSGNGKRPGYGGPQDWGQQERAEKKAAGQNVSLGANNPYAGMSHSQLQNLSKHSPSHGGMHTDWSRDPDYRDAGFRGPPVVDEKAIQEKKEIDWTKQNTKNAWSKGIDAWNSWHNTKNLEWARKNKAKKDKALRDYLESVHTKNPHMDVDEIMEGLAGSWDQSTGTFGKHDFTKGFHKGTTFDISNWGGPELGPFGLSTKGATGKPLGTNYLDSTGDFSTLGMTPVALQALGFSKPNFNTLRSHFNRTSMLNDLIEMGPDLKQADVDAYLDKTNPNRHGGGGDGDNPLWQRLGYPSYEAYMAAMNRSGGGGGGETEEDTDWKTTAWNFDTTYPYPQYGVKDGGRIPAAFGGIMDTQTGRKRYLFGSIKKAVKGVAKAAGKVLKSDVGKMALAGAAFYYGGGGSKIFNTGNGWLSGLGKMGSHFMSKSNPLLFTGGKLSLGKLGLASAALPYLMGEPKPNEDLGMNERGGHLIDPLTGKESTPREMRTTLNTAIEEAGNDPVKLAAIEDAYPYLNLGQYLPYASYGVKDGGRIGAQEGGLMNLGGMEKDYRNNGGFVAIGGEERADDVPARLSRNEFVFTADAVRGAGGGDIDKGAEIMENVMKNLEQGGKISEESQGNAGAQQMFGVSERIGEVL